MADGGFITKEAAKTAGAEPLKIAARAFEDEAPYFVDYVSKLVDETHGGLLAKSGAVDVYTRSTCTCSAWRRKPSPPVSPRSTNSSRRGSRDWRRWR
jgi:membrane carboxypeptidase/penicillin-binding protein